MKIVTLIYFILKMIGCSPEIASVQMVSQTEREEHIDTIQKICESLLLQIRLLKVFYNSKSVDEDLSVDEYNALEKYYICMLSAFDHLTKYVTNTDIINFHYNKVENTRMDLKNFDKKNNGIFSKIIKAIPFSLELWLKRRKDPSTTDKKMKIFNKCIGLFIKTNKINISDNSELKTFTKIEIELFGLMLDRIRNSILTINEGI